MKISSRFSVAIHILSLLHLNKATGITSESLAASVNTNPVVIRRIIGQLKNAQLVANHRGSKGATLIRNLDEITLLDVYRAVDSVEENNLFQIHEHPNPACLVGANIEEALSDSLITAQKKMENQLESETVANIVNRILKIDETKR